MLSQGQELGAIDFANVIGGPLVAVINAQAQAAQTTAAFIQQVGFVSAGSSSGASAAGAGATVQLQTVAFDFSQMIGQGGSGGSSAGGLTSDSTIKVPLLSMIPIPYIRIDSMTLDFNVNLHSTSNVSNVNNFAFANTDSGQQGGSFLSLNEGTKMNVSVTDKNTYQNNSVIDDTYSLKVSVHAVQDEMPGGLKQILNIFQSLIQSQSTMLQTIMTDAIQAQQAALQAQSSPPPATPPAPPPNSN